MGCVEGRSNQDLLRLELCGKGLRVLRDRQFNNDRLLGGNEHMYGNVVSVYLYLHVNIGSRSPHSELTWVIPYKLSRLSRVPLTSFTSYYTMFCCLRNNICMSHKKS